MDNLSGSRNSLFRVFGRIFETLDRWARSGFAGPATGLWGFLQSSIVPGPSDSLLLPLGLANPSRGFYLGCWAAAGSMAGSLVAYWIGALAFNLFGTPLMELIGISETEMATMAAQFAERGWIVIALGLLPLLSSKIVAYSAGALKYPFWTFALLIAILRGGRFLATGAVLQIGGVRARAWLQERAEKRNKSKPDK